MGENATKWDREKHAKINRVQIKTPKRWRENENVGLCHDSKRRDKKTMKKKSHPKTLAPANDQLRSRPATVYEDEVKM